MQIQRTLPGPKDIGALAADHLPYQLPAMASLTHDLLDGYACRVAIRMEGSVNQGFFRIFGAGRRIHEQCE
jgi:hypothetical protein